MKKIFALLAFCAGISCYAQINFEPGYFIDNNGNKTECLIKNLAWINNPSDFEYKASEKAEIKTATAANVQEFSVSDYKYVSRTVNIDRSSRDMSNMSIKKEPEFKKETLFLRVLVSGKKTTLYLYEGSSIERFFFSADSGTPSQLIYKPYLIDGNIAYNNDFRGQLYLLMKDKFKPEEFKKLPYEKRALTLMFSKYEDDGTAPLQIHKQNKATFNVKFTPGICFADVSGIFQFSAQNYTTDFKSDPVFRIGAEAEVVLPFNKNKWSVFIDPNYQKFSSSATTSQLNAQQAWNFNYSFIELPIGIRHYMFLNQKTKLFVDIAYVYTFNAKKEDNLYFDYYSNFSEYNYKTPVKKDINFAAGLGLSYSRYSIEARYSFNRVLNGNYFSSIDYKFFSLIAGYRFL